MEKLLLSQYNGEIHHEMIVDCTIKKKEKRLKKKFVDKTLA
jgi:hypothetical protein